MVAEGCTQEDLDRLFNPEPTDGDLIYFDFTDSDEPQQVGVVIKAHERTGWRHRFWKNRVETVEANTRKESE